MRKPPRFCARRSSPPGLREVQHGTTQHHHTAGRRPHPASHRIQIEAEKRPSQRGRKEAGKREKEKHARAPFALAFHATLRIWPRLVSGCWSGWIQPPLAALGWTADRTEESGWSCVGGAGGGLGWYCWFGLVSRYRKFTLPCLALRYGTEMLYLVLLYVYRA